MINEFEYNLIDKLGIKPSEKILLTVSGGADSVAMLDLFSKTIYKCGIAHCNFHLRGEESDKDEEFVRKLAKNYGFVFHKIDFDTKKYATEKGISIEMAARELRYEWFEKIRQEFDYQIIAIAHHQDDVIETFLINLTRGTGIKGLTGIKEKNGNIIRPMLFTNRDTILKYIEDNKLSFREDASNADVKIIRNSFRHKIIPLLKEINPAVESNILQTIEHLKGTEEIMQQKIDQVMAGLEIEDKLPLNISIEELSDLFPLDAYLYEILKPYGFNATHIKDIIDSLDGESGKKFYSKTHQLIKDRKELIISNLVSKSEIIYISEHDKEIELPDGKLIIEKIEIDKDFKIPTQPHIAALDFDKLKFPLQIKEWEQGDYFYPLGMKQKKKLSDFFVDEKMSLLEKQETRLLISGSQIAWVIGKRIDNRFKITGKTKKVLFLKLL